LSLQRAGFRGRQQSAFAIALTAAGSADREAIVRAPLPFARIAAAAALLHATRGLGTAAAPAVVAPRLALRELNALGCCFAQTSALNALRLRGTKRPEDKQSNKKHPLSHTSLLAAIP